VIRRADVNDVDLWIVDDLSIVASCVRDFTEPTLDNILRAIEPVRIDVTNRDDVTELWELLTNSVAAVGDKDLLSQRMPQPTTPILGRAFALSKPKARGIVAGQSDVVASPIEVLSTSRRVMRWLFSFIGFVSLYVVHWRKQLQPPAMLLPACYYSPD
jgi:hypothetical protein